MTGWLDSSLVINSLAIWVNGTYLGDFFSLLVIAELCMEMWFDLKTTSGFVFVKEKSIF